MLARPSRDPHHWPWWMPSTADRRAVPEVV